MSKAVVNGELKRISVSQITQFDHSQDGGCHRRWWFTKVLGLESPPTKAQEAGTRLHAEIEHYLKTSEMTLSKYALAGLPFIPTPGTVDVEHSIKGYSIAGVQLVGFIDALNLSPHQIEEDASVETTHPYGVEIIDWKSTSDLKYAKSGSDLLKTIQMPVYADYALSLCPDVESVRLSHVYFTKKGTPKAKKSSAKFPLARIRERTQAIEGLVSQMKALAYCSEVGEVGYNSKACNAFGGCPFASECPRTANDFFDLHTVEGVSTMGLFDNVKRTNAPQSSPAKETPVSKVAEAKQQLLEEERRAIEMFAPTSRGIVPPDAVPNPKIAEPIPSDELISMPRVIQDAANKVAPSQEAPTLFSQPAKKEPSVIVTQDRIEPLPECREIYDGPLELYVDCHVTGLETQDLWPIIAETLQRIESEHNLPDVRLAQSGHVLAYGAWKGVLAAQLKARSLEGRYHLRNVRESEFKQIALEALSTKASLIVRGL